MFHLMKNIAICAAAATCTSNSIAHQIDATAFNIDERTEVSFKNLPMDFGRTGPVIADGITFTSGSGSFRTYPSTAPFPGNAFTQVCAERGCIMTNAELDYIAVTLPTPVSMVGAYLGITNEATTAVAEFYSGSTLLGLVNISARPFEGVFAGWNAGGASITSVKFIDNQDQQFVLGLTGFTYQITSSVPEPSAILQAMLGLCLGGFILRRRKFA